MTRLKETTVAASVVSFLEERGWEVFQEVQLGNSVADIVAVQNKRYWIIEVKTSLSLDLLAQGHNWLGQAHWVSIAAPEKRSSRKTTRFVRDRLRDWGLGLLEVSTSGRWSEESDGVARCKEVISARLIRKKWRYLLRDLQRLRVTLQDEHKTFALAGTASGKRWTTWKHTLRSVREAVVETPGVTLKALIEETHGFHYANNASARSSLAHWLKMDRVPGVQMRDGRLYPEKL